MSLPLTTVLALIKSKKQSVLQLQEKGLLPQPLIVSIVDSRVLEQLIELELPLPSDTTIEPYHIVFRQHFDELMTPLNFYSYGSADELSDWPSMTLRLNNMFPRGTLIQLRPFLACANATKAEILLRHEERDLPYCFDATDLSLIEEYEVNPYTGRSYTLDAPRLPDVSKACVSDGKKLTTVAPEHPTGTYLLGYRHLLKRIPDLAIARAVTAYKRCEELRIYRGIRFTETCVRAYPLDYTMDIVVKSITSWTTNIHIARAYASLARHSVIVSMVVSPIDVVFDSSVPAIDFNARNSEVRVRPGVYEVRITASK